MYAPTKQEKIILDKTTRMKQKRYQKTISVIGLGYVGLMIAAAFAKSDSIIGFDVNLNRIAALKNGYDVNGELSTRELQQVNIQYTSHPEDLRTANFHIIAVPTPLDHTKHPDLSILLNAS